MRPDPDPLHRPVLRCTYRGCDSTDIATLDGINGRRCADHPPTFDPDTAVELMRRGLPGAALAYVRGAA